MSSKLIKCRFCSGLNDSKFGINLENIPSKAQKFSKNSFFYSINKELDNDFYIRKNRIILLGDANQVKYMLDSKSYPFLDVPEWRTLPAIEKAINEKYIVDQSNIFLTQKNIDKLNEFKSLL